MLRKLVIAGAFAASMLGTTTAQAEFPDRTVEMGDSERAHLT